MIRWFRSLFSKKHLTEQLLYMGVFATIFAMAGFYLPRAYLQYLDNTSYIDVSDLISFDRKVYAPCDTATAVIKAKLSVNSPTTTRTRLMKVLTNKQPPDNFKIIKTSESNGFVNAKPTVQSYVVDYKIPCDLEDGIYLFRGETTYHVDGVEKTEMFETALFTIDHTQEPLRKHN